MCGCSVPETRAKESFPPPTRNHHRNPGRTVCGWLWPRGLWRRARTSRKRNRWCQKKRERAREKPQSCEKERATCVLLRPMRIATRRVRSRSCPSRRTRRLVHHLCVCVYVCTDTMMLLCCYCARVVVLSVLRTKRRHSCVQSWQVVGDYSAVGMRCLPGPVTTTN